MIFRKFEDIYNVERFVRSLDGVVKVETTQPAEVSSRNLAVVKVPNRVSEDYIAENIEPVFTSKGNIRLATYFPSVNMKKTKEKSNTDSIACMSMFGTLELQPEVNEVVESMVERLRTLSSKSKGQFVAVDLRVDILEKKSCQGDSSLKSKSCYGPEEIGMFLRKIGFNKDTTLYLTQSRWDSSLDALKDLFPKTYTKVWFLYLLYLLFHNILLYYQIACLESKRIYMLLCISMCAFTICVAYSSENTTAGKHNAH